MRVQKNVGGEGGGRITYRERLGESCWLGLERRWLQQGQGNGIVI